MTPRFLAALVASLAGALGASLLVPAPASAAVTHTVCATGCTHATIQEAVAAAGPGDTIDVAPGDYSVDGRIDVAQDDLAIVGTPGARLTQTGDSVTFALSGSGTSLSGLEITSDAPAAAAFVHVTGDAVWISDNLVHGPPQPPPMATWVANTGVAVDPSVAGLVVDGNRFHTMRTGLHLQKDSTGSIRDNVLHGLDLGVVIDDANVLFDGNRDGDPAFPNRWGFVILPGTNAFRYTSIRRLTQTNNYMTVWDQRDDETYEHRTLTVCATGCDFAAIADAVAEAAVGETIEIAPGDYTTASRITVMQADLTITAAEGATLVQTGDEVITFLITGDGVTLSGLEITSATASEVELVQVGADDVSLLDLVLRGPHQDPPRSAWVANRGLVAQGGILGLRVEDSTFRSLRHGMYLDGNSRGTVHDNVFSDAEADIVIDGADVAFTGNASDPSGPASEWGFVVLAGTPLDRYADIATLAQSNHFMTVWDQRDDETYVAPVCAAAGITTHEDVPGQTSITCDGGAAQFSFEVGTGDPPQGAATVDDAGVVTYTPAADVHGTDTFVVEVTDRVGSTDDVDITVEASPSNDAPSFAPGPDQRVLMSSGRSVVDGWATSISPGPADETAQSVRFATAVTSTTGDLGFAVAPRISRVGRLVFTPSRGTHGKAVVEVVAIDDGPRDAPNVRRSAPSAFTIHVRRPTVTITGPSAPRSEGSVARFPVRLSDPVTYPILLRYATVGGSAEPVRDYIVEDGEMEIPAGSGGRVGTISVKVRHDRTVELDEDFSIELRRATGATARARAAVATIAANDT